MDQVGHDERWTGSKSFPLMVIQHDENLRFWKTGLFQKKPGFSATTIKRTVLQAECIYIYIHIYTCVCISAEPCLAPRFMRGSAAPGR